MPLNKSCNEFLGKTLFILPFYGNGWTRQDLGAPPQTQLDSLGPEPFHIRLDEFIYCNDQIEGISGIIEEQQHNLNGHWCCCLLRSTDDCNFSEHPGHYLVWITKDKFPVNPAPYPKKALFEWVEFDKTKFGLCGFGTVAVSVNWVQDLYNRASGSRQRVKERG
jgi:hypothetical protein